MTTSRPVPGQARARRDDSSADLVPEAAPWLTLAELGEAVGMPVGRLQRMVAEGGLVTLRRGPEQVVPAAFAQDGALVRGLGGLLTVLGDAGYSAGESVRWLFRADDVIGGRPVDLLRAGRPTVVRRRAQELGF